MRSRVLINIDVFQRIDTDLSSLLHDGLTGPSRYEITKKKLSTSLGANQFETGVLSGHHEDLLGQSGVSVRQSELSVGR